jgi:hypothetical protein
LDDCEVNIITIILIIIIVIIIIIILRKQIMMMKGSSNKLRNIIKTDFGTNDDETVTNI